MIHRDELYRNAAAANGIPRLDHIELGALEISGFLELSFDQTDRQSRRIHWNIELLEQVAQARPIWSS